MDIALYQIRADSAAAAAERAAIVRSTGISEKHFHIYNMFDAEPRLPLCDAIIIGGSPCSVLDAPSENLVALRGIVERAMNKRRRPVGVLGICYGAQFLAHVLGGTVRPVAESQEFGTFMIDRTEEGAGDPLLAHFPARFPAHCYHEDSITALPPGAVLLARSDRCEVQAFRFGERVYGVQFHPERNYAEALKALAEFPDAKVRETPEAGRLLSKFLQEIVSPQ